FILLLFWSIKSYSQDNFSRIAFGISGGLTKSYTGLTYGASSTIPGFVAKDTYVIADNKTFGGSLDYYFTPFINAGISYDKISIRQEADKNNRAFISNFSAIEVKGKVSVGQFVDFSSTPFLYSFRNLYVGLGIGFINGKNNVGDYVSGSNPSDAKPYFPRRMNANDFGKSKFSGVISLPLSFGYFINIYNSYQEPKVVLGIDYKLVYAFSDDLDGYKNDPSYFSNKSKDVYTTLGLSVKYLFGPQGLYYR
ncbi:MAG: hypothetical protein KJ712_05985, partial [Bacteroidetes bacterium]|nr:hypothetical protein [Bacteroidota bacterium]